MIYLDNAATAPLRRSALERMWPYLTGDFGNAASHNSLGYTAATAVADAREQLGEILGVSGADLVFTSGGTESDNLAVKGIALAAPRGRHIVVSATEHPAVLESASYLVEQHGFALTLLPVTHEGLVEPSVLADALRDDTTLVSIAYANNEIGAVQPIAELAAVAHSRGVPFHTDAVQAAGWLPLDVRELGVDALSLAGHKFGAPKGVGVLYCAPSVRLQPLIHGGGQQRGARSGTENVAGVVGLAAALAEAEQERKALAPQVEALREHFLSRVLAEVPDAVLTGPRHLRLAAHASFCFPGTSGEALLLELEAEDIISSSGSACAAGSDAPSPVLTALGIPADVAQTAVRLTFSAHTTQEQLDITADALVSAVTSLRSRYGSKG